MKMLLHAGCGSKVNTPPREFAAYKEIRLDCNRAVQPDVISSIVAMPILEDCQYDAVFASHVLEHLHRHEVAMALGEFYRVLKPGGYVLIHVPDLQAIGGRIGLDQLDNVLYASAIGPVTPLDMLYGHGGSVGSGNLFMGHHTGFTQGVLSRQLVAAGFDKVTTDRQTEYELKARGFKPEVQNACSISGTTRVLEHGNGS